MAKKKIPLIIEAVRKFTPPDVDYRYQKTISFSQFSVFESCPHKWALQYRDGHYKSEVSIHMTFGTAIHETMQNYLEVMYNGSTAAADRINIEEYFEERLRAVYKEDYKKNNNTHFSNSAELGEFYEDGIGILQWFKRNKGKYFSKRSWWLVGIEVPILLPSSPVYNNILYKGYIDVVLYNETLNKIKIIDIKTSTRGWKDKEKTDEVKNSQVILYKKFFSEQFNFPVDNIDVEYFIVKRKLHGNPDFPDPRVQIHVPASGKIKLNKATKHFEEFIEMAFDNEGKHRQGYMLKNPSKQNCQYCPFKDRKDLCDKNVS